MRPILSLLLLGAVMPAFAQEPPAPPPGLGPMRGAMLMRADANGDGAISRDEAVAAADARFDRLDANHDGTVTPEEMRAARDAMRRTGGPAAPPSPPQPSGDARPDRVAPQMPALTRETSRHRALEAFARADTNGDGTIDRTELANLRPMRGPGPRGGRPSGDLPPPQG